MTKLQRVLTSLIAVVPAVYLIYIIVVQVMLSKSENLTTIAYVVLGLTLISMVVTVLIPAAIWVGGKPKPEPAKSAAKLSSDEEDIEGLDDSVEISHGSSGSFDAQDVLAESSEHDLGDSDLDMLDQDSVSDFEDFEIDEEEEEEKPKSKKKKR